MFNINGMGADLSHHLAGNIRMKNEYECTVIFGASAGVTIEADSPEEAADLAEQELAGVAGLCHECSSHLETGDAVGVLVYLGNEMVADTTMHGSAEAELKVAKARIAQLEARKPLTEVEIIRLWGEVQGTRNGYEPLVRAVEAVHGIK